MATDDSLGDPTHYAIPDPASLLLKIGSGELSTDAERVAAALLLDSYPHARHLAGDVDGLIMMARRLNENPELVTEAKAINAARRPKSRHPKLP